MRGQVALLLTVVGLMTVAPAVQASHLPDQTGVRVPALHVASEADVIDLCDGATRQVEVLTAYGVPEGSLMLHPTETHYAVTVSSPDLTVAINPSTQYASVPAMGLLGGSWQGDNTLTLAPNADGDACRTVSVQIDLLAEKNGLVSSQTNQLEILVKIPASAS